MSLNLTPEQIERRERHRLAQRIAFAGTLRRLADLYESGALPLPITSVRFSLNFHEDENGRELAAVAAEALGVDWTAEHVAGSRTYLVARANMRPAPIDLTMLLHLDDRDDEPPPPPPAVELVRALNDAAHGERQALIAAQGEPITRESFEAQEDAARRAGMGPAGGAYAAHIVGPVEPEVEQ